MTYRMFTLPNLMPTFRIHSHKNNVITITAPDERTARSLAMQEFHGSPQPFGYVARKYGETSKKVRPAVSPREWTGAGLMVEEID